MFILTFLLEKDVARHNENRMAGMSSLKQTSTDVHNTWSEHLRDSWTQTGEDNVRLFISTCKTRRVHFNLFTSRGQHRCTQVMIVTFIWSTGTNSEAEGEDPWVSWLYSGRVDTGRQAATNTHTNTLPHLVSLQEKCTQFGNTCEQNTISLFNTWKCSLTHHISSNARIH